MIFVFGSNISGRHGKGAAKYAVEHHGAIYGQGYGLQGNSFAIPTRYFNGVGIATLPLDQIEEYVNSFLAYARSVPDTEFQITALGTGLAGYKHEEIAPMFKDAPSNCTLPKEWLGLC
jgi:hypothetical protein